MCKKHVKSHPHWLWKAIRATYHFWLVYVLVCLCFVLVCLCFGMFMWYMYVSSRYQRVPERGLLTGMCELHWILQLFLLHWIQSELRPDHLYRYITFNINFYPFVSSEFFHPFFFNRQSLFHWKTVYLLVKWGSHFLYVQHMFSIGKLCKT